jgi:CubicO group peptidase (beta-lactamase class C family)
MDERGVQRIEAGTAVYDAIDAYVEQRMGRLQVPGAALAVVEGDRIAHLRGFGRAHPDGAAPSPQTPFVIGSVTKSFTALAVMQLAEAGQIALDAPVRRYLPWFRVADPDAAARITVRHLLSHTSGLSSACGWAPMTGADRGPGAAARQARALAAAPLARPVGAAFEYSNANYDLLGLVVEAAGGESYAAYVEHHIFGPLDMRHSHASREGARRDRLAMGHRYWFGHPVPDPDEELAPGSLPSSLLLSSAEDMAHYLIAHLNGGRYGGAQLLSPEGLAELHRPAVAANQGVLKGHYAMGWLVDEAGPTRVVWHDGVVPDFFAYVALLPERQRGCVLFFNADHFAMVPALGEVGHGVAALLAGARPAPARWGAVTPWALRALLAVPALQAVGVATTLRRLRGWAREPDRRPARRRAWVLHVLLPLAPNLLLAAAPVLLLSSGLARFLLRFGPDVSWVALVCGGFAGIWAFVRTGLVLRGLRGQ